MSTREKFRPSLIAKVRKDTINQFLSKDKTPASVLLLSVIVGVLAGLVGTYFELAVHFISETRTEWLKSEISTHVPLWFAAFLISAGLAFVGYYLVHRFAPEASGSGIPEIEGAMDGMRPVRWWRVLPVKFFGGMGALGSGMVLGREGPTVQMGGAIGRMVSDIFRVKDDDSRHSLLACGAAGGLAAAFNAPLAGIMFIIEEMRPQFRYTLISIKAVIISAISADIVFRMIKSQDAVITMPQYQPPGIDSLWLFLVLGIFFGIFGVFFNKLVTIFQDIFVKIHRNDRKRYLITGTLLGGCFGLTLLYIPELTGGGIHLIPTITTGTYSASFLLLLFLGRILTTMLCFGSGAPGGIFAPMLALGTLFGYAFGAAANSLFPQFGIDPGMFAIAGMGALFAATVRAPITGILLVIEMTNNYYLILPLIITGLGAVIFAQLLGGQPIYSQLLHRTLRKEKLQQQDVPPQTEQQQQEMKQAEIKEDPVK
ncbi:H(+)/Cl(-) exchange transporter ClcA [Vibrio sp.]|uniref:H(+)/Cl(-) exchange transporter ClcA n=1 Tax=Vibrio viridaestus TaxID=2487322 RepID=A0A3N9TE65_9VIBR|nr:H(+)/Cl(-) exchange transporter ClcA [Vibrio viridaestus]MDC0610956.1 H(+)/Cl(-) exchange transporter ClcA [Vibrio sp.]RQW62134.1 H(+)/Cl(-) exchange transporter ClcA [Vibrio viridaestus]